MTVCLSVKTAGSETTFTYNGETPELWTAAIHRVLTDPVIKSPTAQVNFENSEYFVTAKEVRRLRDRVRLPDFFVDVERVVQQVSNGQWSEELQIPREHFKRAVQLIWTACREKLELEPKILDALYREGNGGLKVDSILSRLLAAGVVARFAAVRDGLGHLCKLYLVERCYGQFSVRNGMLSDKAFMCE